MPENKRHELEKEGQERKRVRKLLKTHDGATARKRATQRARRPEHRDHRVAGHAPGGNADGYQNKGFAGKAIRKTMKTKGRQTGALFIRKATARVDGV